MITDVRASKMFLLLHEGESVAAISRRLKMSDKTVRKYRDAGQLPSQIERPERSYRTRQDPLAEFWSEIEALLQQDSRLKPYAILDWLKQKHNPPEGQPQGATSSRRNRGFSDRVLLRAGPAPGRRHVRRSVRAVGFGYKRPPEWGVESDHAYYRLALRSTCLGNLEDDATRYNTATEFV